MAELHCVAPELVAEIWPHASDYVRSAIERTGLTPFDVVENDVLQGRSLLWLETDGHAIDGAGVTILEGDVCVIVAFGGHDKSRSATRIAEIEGYAKDQGCRAVRIIGRRGWERVLPDYRHRYSILERPI